MIYVASLQIPVKKALKDQVQQSNLIKICKQLPLDPDTTNMDVVFLGPKDLIGPKAVQLQKAIENKHPDICVIYLYNKDNERDLIDVECKKQCKKITTNVITEAFEEFVEQHKVRAGKQQVTSADFVVQKDDELEEEPLDDFGDMLPGDDEVIPDVQKVKPRAYVSSGDAHRQNFDIPDIDTSLFTTPQEAEGPVSTQEILGAFDPSKINAAMSKKRPSVALDKEVAEDSNKEQTSPMGHLSDDGLLESLNSDTEGYDVQQQEVNTSAEQQQEHIAYNLDFEGNTTPCTQQSVPVQNLYQNTPMGTAEGNQSEKSAGKVEEYLSRLNNVEEWSIYKEKLRKDSIVRTLIEENSEYAGLVNMLDVLDRRIEAVWRDSALSANQRFEKIKEIGLEKATVRAATNSINVEKAISIISTIILSAKRTVEEKLDSIDSAMSKLAVDKESIADTSLINQTIEERMKVQLDLMETVRGIIDLYMSVENLVSDEIQELDAKLPSSNQFINGMVKPIGTQIFTPQNTAALANKLNKALQENRVIASQMESSVNAVMKLLFELCSKDEEIIRYQQQTIDMFKANRVEDVVITNSLLKKSMRLYVGMENTGRSATAITWSGILSRRNNCLVLDLTRTPKFREYGIEPVSLDDFMQKRIEKQLLCVESKRILNPEELQAVVEQLRSRLNYYSYVNVILEPEDINALNQLSVDALCVHYITNCTTASIQCMAEVCQQHTYDNVARKLITVNAPVSPLMIADSIGVDATVVKLITLPNVDAVKACALRHDRPFEYSDIVYVYEEAFR